MDALGFPTQQRMGLRCGAQPMPACLPGAREDAGGT